MHFLCYPPHRLASHTHCRHSIIVTRVPGENAEEERTAAPCVTANSPVSNIREIRSTRQSPVMISTMRKQISDSQLSWTRPSENTSLTQSTVTESAKQKQISDSQLSWTRPYENVSHIANCHGVDTTCENTVTESTVTDAKTHL